MNRNYFFTQAGNFTSAINGGVDPRTGMYNINISLGNINANKQQGPEFPVSLYYSPLSMQNDMNMGIGVSLGVSVFNTETGRLYLSTGENYQTENAGGGVIVKQKKLDSFHFEKQSSKAYKITHKTGDLEILQGSDSGRPVKLPSRMVNSAGHSLIFTTDSNNRLSSLKDDGNVLLLTVEYTSATTTMNFYPSTPNSYQIILSKKNDYLTAITRRCSGEPDLVWKLAYQDMGVWGNWATSLTSPSGLTQTVKYRTDQYAHQFPESSPEYADKITLPCVYSYEAHAMDGELLQVSSFTFTGQNFLGWNSGISWDALQDGLYNCRKKYEYSSTETQGKSGSESIIITRTYNNFHLQTDENTISESKTYSVLKHTDYYAKIGQPFDQQPKQFQLPTKTTSTWKDGSTGLQRTETVDTTYDESGNPLSRTEADGTATLWSYYETGGEKNACPAEPNGFTRFTKSMSVTSPSQPGYISTQKVTNYTYTSMYPTANNDVTFLVMRSHEDSFIDDNKMASTDYSYHTGFLASVVKQKTTTLFDTDGKAFKTTENFDYDITKTDEVTSSYTLISHDNFAVTDRKTVSAITGRTVETIDTRGIKTRLTHNSLGLVLSRTHAVDTTYEVKKTYDYHHEGKIFFITSTDPLGNKTRLALDGLGRQVYKQMNDIDTGNENNWYTLHEQSFDLLGRKQQQSVSDYAPVNSVKAVIMRSQDITYDDWGQIKSETTNDVTSRTKTSLVADLAGSHNAVWQTAIWNEGGGCQSACTVTTLDDSHNPVKVEFFNHVDDLTPYSRFLREFDGLGQLRSETAPGPGDQKTKYEYDPTGRPVTTTLADKTKIVKTYVGFCTEKLATSITVINGKGNRTEMGSRVFDGLGRLVSENCGGRAWEYQYDDGQHHPSVIKTPDGGEERYTYIPELNDVPASRHVTRGKESPLIQIWDYDTISGALLSASEDMISEENTYLGSGLMHSTRIHDCSGSKDSQFGGYTVGGLSGNYTDFAGKCTSVERDSAGREICLTDEDGVTCELEYDGLGQLISWTTTHPLGAKIITTLTLDTFGRETKREIRTRYTNDARAESLLTVSQEWSVKNQITRRETSRNLKSVRIETYTYDPQRGWLTLYNASGTELPLDETGYQLQVQTFSYDQVTGNMLMKGCDYKNSNPVGKMYLYADARDPCRLTGIKDVQKGTTVSLDYDDAGRMTKDENGRTLSYDCGGRLLRVSGSDGKEMTAYVYDALNRLASQTTEGTITRRYYNGNSLSFLDDGVNSTRLPGAFAQISTGINEGIWLNSTDISGSVLAVTDGINEENYAYSPYGSQRIID